MEWNTSNITEIIDYINSELRAGRTMVNIEREVFGVNERVVHKRLIRAGYKKIDNQYTSNITSIKSDLKPRREVLKVSNVNTIEEIEKEPAKEISSSIDTDKLNILLNNLDKLLKLIPKETTSNITGLKSGINDVKSFRIDTGLYQQIKKRAARDNVNISEIINRSLEDYLNNYL